MGLRSASATLCVIAVMLSVTAAGRAADGEAFTEYLARSEFKPIYLTELRRLALEEGNLWALRDYAGMLQDAGHILRAGAFAESLECRSTELDALAMLIRGEGLLRGRLYDQALATLDSLVSAFPVKPALIEAQYLRARCLFDLGRYEDARIHLRTIRDEAESLRASITYYLALCDEELGDIEEAEDGFEVLHEAAFARGTAGLMRCHLRAGEVERAQSVYRDAVARDIDLPHDESIRLLDITDWGAPLLWDDLMAGLAADTTYLALMGMEMTLLRAAERGVDVNRYCEAFLARGGPDELRYVRAISLEDKQAAYDSLLVLAAAGDVNRPIEYDMAMAYIASRDTAIAMPRESRLAGTVPQPGDQWDPNETVYWLDMLVENGRGGVITRGVAPRPLELSPGFDDQAMFEIADLLDRAGRGAAALEIYNQVSRSPLPSEAAFACERRIYLAGLTPSEDEDVSSVVEQVAEGDRSNLELARVFDERLRDYAKAADYYQRAARETEDAAERDRIRLKAATAFSNDYLKTGNGASRDKALNFAAALAPSEAVSPRGLIDLLKSSTDWLTLDLFRSTEAARALAAREDLDDAALLELARVLYRLYERGDAPAYELCLGVLGRLLDRESPPPGVERAAFLDAQVRLRRGDYSESLERFGACRKLARDSTIKRLCRMGMGDCYVGSGGFENGLEHYGKAGDSPSVGLREARCYQVLGKTSEALKASRSVPGYYTAKDVSVAARMLTGILSAAGRGLPRDAFVLYFDRYHYLGMHEDYGDYIPLLAAYDLALRGYDGLAVRVLEGHPRARLEGVHCQIFLSGYDAVTGDHAGFFRALSDYLGPNCVDALDAYAQSNLRAELECSSELDEICLRSGERFKQRYPLATGAANDIDAIRANSLYREMYVGMADAVADSLFKQGVRSELLAEAVYRKGVSFLLDEANEEAKQTFLIMDEYFPESNLRPDVHFKLGTTCYLMEAYDSSAVFFRLAAGGGKVELEEDALFNLGLALEESGDLAGASEAFYELAVRFPFSEKFERALMRSAYCLEKNDLPMEARDIYKTLLAYAEGSETRAEANFWLGECLAKAGYHVEAALEFIRTGYLYPGEEAWAGTARYRAGMECESAGLGDAAELIYGENVRTFGRESTWGAASYERLRELVEEG